MSFSNDRFGIKENNVMINYTNTDSEIILKASIPVQVLYEAVKICREIPEAEVMTEDTFIDGRNYPRFNDVLDRARRVILAGLDSATSVNPSSGGGCMSNGYAMARQELGLSSFRPLRQGLRSCPVLS